MGDELNGTMNDTKWQRLRVTMLELGVPTKWRTKDVENGHISHWDADWFHHFGPPFRTIEWLEIVAVDSADHDRVAEALGELHVSGEEDAGVFRILGWVRPGSNPVYFVP